MTPRVYIGLGANLGDRLNNIVSALICLNRCAGLKLLSVSSIYETEPVGCPNQADYLNGAACFKTELQPMQVLACCQQVETAGGRIRKERWQARTIDLDVLLYEQEIIHSGDLTIPHPLLTKRRFVLTPLAEIAPNMMVPGSNQTIRELLTVVQDDSRVKLYMTLAKLLDKMSEV